MCANALETVHKEKSISSRGECKKFAQDLRFQRGLVCKPQIEGEPPRSAEQNFRNSVDSQ